MNTVLYPKFLNLFIELLDKRLEHFSELRVHNKLNFTHNYYPLPNQIKNSTNETKNLIASAVTYQM